MSSHLHQTFHYLRYWLVCAYIAWDNGLFVFVLLEILACLCLYCLRYWLVCACIAWDTDLFVLGIVINIIFRLYMSRMYSFKGFSYFWSDCKVCNHKKYFGNHPLESTSLLTIKQLFITLPTYELPTSLSNLCLNVQAVNVKEFYLLLYSITLQ